jgi:hypothetical protein
MKRRDFLRAGAVVAAGGLLRPDVPAAAAAPRAAEPPLPTVRLGSLDVSRFILGSNPFWGISHTSDARDAEMRSFYTDERIARVLDEAADCGLNAIVSPPDARWIGIWARYREARGRLPLWISQCHGRPEQMPAEIDRSIKAGAQAIFIQGVRVEEQFAKGNFDTLRAWIERIRAAGLPAGAAAHWPEIHLELERRKFPTDFYFQCVYNASKTSDYSAAEREAAMATIDRIAKPVVAYKILGAGRLKAAEGFEFVFNRIKRKDGVCVGIFAREAIDQIRQNATYTRMLTGA